MKELTKGCLKCPKPLCKENCPLHTEVPSIVKAVEEDDINKALEILYSKNPFPLLTGLFCNGYCFQNCVLNRAGRPYIYQNLEKALGHLDPPSLQTDDILKNRKIAIIGAGPVGMALGILLKRSNAQVVIYEKDPDYLFTIKKVFPETKVSKEEVDCIDKFVKTCDLDIRLNTTVGVDVMLDDLRKEYDYVVLAAGHNISKTDVIHGASGGIYYAYDFLVKLKDPTYLDNFGDDFLLYGLGNVSIDLAVYLKHKGKNVKLFYHKPREKSRLSPHDIKKIDVYNLDVTYDTRCLNVENNNATMEHEGNEYVLSNMTVIFAIGQKSDFAFLNNSEVKEEDLTYDLNCESKVKDFYLAGDFSSTRWDISTGFETAWQIYNHLKDLEK